MLETISDFSNYLAWTDKPIAENREADVSGSRHGKKQVFVWGFRPVGMPQKTSRHVSWKDLQDVPCSAAPKALNTETLRSRATSGIFHQGTSRIFITVHSCSGVERKWIVWPSRLDESRFAKARQEIRSFRDLPKDWDSYDSEPPSETAIGSALSIIDHLESLGVEPDWCIPTSDDSILLQFQLSDATYKWELESDGDIGVMIKPQEEEPHYLDLRAEGISEFFDTYCHGVL